MRALLTYTVLRLGLFAGTLVVLLVLGMGEWFALIVAVGVSAMLSYVLLRPHRDAATAEIAARVERRSAAAGSRTDQDAAHEDAVLDTPTDTPSA